MFTDDELEGCPSVWVEEWLERNEVQIREAATIRSYAPSFRIYESGDTLEKILALLFKLVNDIPNRGP